MVNTIAILGSTGSIGNSTLKSLSTKSSQKKNLKSNYLLQKKI